MNNLDFITELFKVIGKWLEPVRPPFGRSPVGC
jgi:hypothetical protein